jgi:hypothetical protein
MRQQFMCRPLEHRDHVGELGACGVAIADGLTCEDDARSVLMRPVIRSRLNIQCATQMSLVLIRLFAHDAPTVCTLHHGSHAQAPGWFP